MTRSRSVLWQCITLTPLLSYYTYSDLLRLTQTYSDLLRLTQTYSVTQLLHLLRLTQNYSDLLCSILQCI